MYDEAYDAIIDIDASSARIEALSYEALDWIETHVTLEQAQLWTGRILEVAPHDIGDLIVGMLADGLKISTAGGYFIEHRSQCSTAFFMTQVSLN